jgi:hypothetical protein
LLSQDANEAISLQEGKASQSCRINRRDAMRWIFDVGEERINGCEHGCG